MEGQTYYFTFGTDPEFPYQGGWVEVQATSRDEAVEKFNKFYPPRYPDRAFVNCAFIYPEEAFKETRMYELANNLGYACHDRI